MNGPLRHMLSHPVARGLAQRFRPVAFKFVEQKILQNGVYVQPRILAVGQDLPGHVQRGAAHINKNIVEKELRHIVFEAPTKGGMLYRDAVIVETRHHELSCRAREIESEKGNLPVEVHADSKGAADRKGRMPQGREKLRPGRQMTGINLGKVGTQVDPSYRRVIGELEIEMRLLTLAAFGPCHRSLFALADVEIERHISLNASLVTDENHIRVIGPPSGFKPPVIHHHQGIDNSDPGQVSHGTVPVGGGQQIGNDPVQDVVSLAFAEVKLEIAFPGQQNVDFRSQHINADRRDEAPHHGTRAQGNRQFRDLGENVSLGPHRLDAHKADVQSPFPASPGEHRILELKTERPILGPQGVLEIGREEGQ